MLIVTATNVTKVGTKRPLARKDGTSDYEVWVGINQHRIWDGPIKGHKRNAGAAVLLRLIADAMEAHPRSEPNKQGNVTKALLTLASSSR